MKKKPRSKPAKPRAAKNASMRDFIDAYERDHWDGIKTRIAAARESVAKGKTRKWDLDRFVAEAERRRKAKLAAE